MTHLLQALGCGTNHEAVEKRFGGQESPVVFGTGVECHVV